MSPQFCGFYLTYFVTADVLWSSIFHCDMNFNCSWFNFPTTTVVFLFLIFPPSHLLLLLFSIVIIVWPTGSARFGSARRQYIMMLAFTTNGKYEVPARIRFLNTKCIKAIKLHRKSAVFTFDNPVKKCVLFFCITSETYLCRKNERVAVDCLPLLPSLCNYYYIIYLHN